MLFMSLWRVRWFWGSLRTKTWPRGGSCTPWALFGCHGDRGMPGKSLRAGELSRDSSAWLHPEGKENKGAPGAEGTQKGRFTHICGVLPAQQGSSGQRVCGAVAAWSLLRPQVSVLGDVHNFQRRVLFPFLFWEENRWICQLPYKSSSLIMLRFLSYGAKPLHGQDNIRLPLHLVHRGLMD